MPGPVVILSVTPRGPKGAVVGRIEGTELRLIATRNPMISAARSLLYLGLDPRTILILRTTGSAINRTSGTLDAIMRKIGRKKPAQSPAKRNSGPDGPP